MERELRRQKEAREEEASRGRGRRSPRRTEPAAEVAEPAEEIINYAMLYDLVVMGLKTFFHFGTSEEPGETIDKLLR